MTRKRAYGVRTVVPSVSLAMLCLILVTSCGDSSEERMAADSECQQVAATRSGYNQAQTAGSGSSVGKGAAIGAAGGAAVGAISSKKSKNRGKDAAKGAAVGAAAGAGAGALKDSDDRKKAEQAQKAYEMEYRHCMEAKGF